MFDDPVKMVAIIGSTRAGRFAPTVARWFESCLQKRRDIVFDMLDLAQTPLPDTLPAFGEVLNDHDARLLASISPRLASADAFVLITPEYNRSFPASLKNAIDWHNAEWRAKPVGFVSYGGVSGGLRAIEQLRLVLAELHAVTVRDSVSFANAWEKFDAVGDAKDAASLQAADRLLNQLVWWARALREAKVVAPYAV